MNQFRKKPINPIQNQYENCVQQRGKLNQNSEYLSAVSEGEGLLARPWYVRIFMYKNRERIQERERGSSEPSAIAKEEREFY